MYTETELREMLRVSADRAPATESMPAASSSPERTFTETGPTSRRGRRRFVAPIAVAAATAAVIAGVFALTQHPDAGHAAAATDPARATAPQGAPHARATHIVQSPRRTLTVPVVDEVRIDTENSTENYVGVVDGGHGQQVVTSQLRLGRAANLVIAPGSAFDDAKVPHTRPVAIAGTTGYYAVLRLFPLSAGGDGGSAPTGTVVFRTPNGHWAFAWLQAGTKGGNLAGTPVDDPAAIVRGFDSLHASFVAGSDRTPMRVGYLPAGAEFDDADLDAAHSRLNVASLLTEDGKKQLDIDILASSANRGGAFDDGTTCIKVVGCTVRRHRDLPGGFTLSVNGTNYSAAQTQKVLDHITVATDPNDPSTYFLLTEAIG